jgi:hypothetical protein
MKTAALDDLAVDPQALADEEAVAQSFANGTPLDPEVGRRVRERGQMIREEIRRQYGTLDAGVPAIRELRGELPA